MRILRGSGAAPGAESGSIVMVSRINSVVV